MGSTSIASKQEEGEEEESYLYAMQLASACVLPMVLKSAIELDLLELIKKAGPGAYVSPAQLASQLPGTTDPETLDRMLRLLASYSVLNCKLTQIDGSNNKVERLYGLAPVCKFLSKNEDGVSVAPFLLVSHGRASLESWSRLTEFVAEGGDIPFKKAQGMTGYEYMGADPTFGALFNGAMSDHSTILMKKILETYGGFQGLDSIVDVGGGTGASLHMIVSRYPTIKGTNFDLPRVVSAAPSYPGVEHVGGDMFVSVPKADAVFMKWVSHNWSDEKVLKLLKNCYEALPAEKGKVILVDSISPEMPDDELSTRTVFHMDVIMLAHVVGGKQRTEMEFQALAEAAGFGQLVKVCRVYDMWVMELRKVHA